MAERNRTAKPRDELTALNKNLRAINKEYEKSGKSVKDWTKLTDQMRTITEQEIDVLGRLIIQQRAAGDIRAAGRTGEQLGQAQGMLGQLPPERMSGIAGMLEKGANIFEQGMSGFVRALPAGAALMVGFDIFKDLFDRTAGLNQQVMNITTASGGLEARFKISDKKLADAVDSLILRGLVKTEDEAYAMFDAVIREVPRFADTLSKSGKGMEDFLAQQKLMGLSGTELAGLQGRYARTLGDSEKVQKLLIRASLDAQEVAKTSDISQTLYSQELMRATDAMAGFPEAMSMVPELMMTLKQSKKVIGEHLAEATSGITGAGTRMGGGFAMFAGMLMGETDPLKAGYAARHQPEQAGIELVKFFKDSFGGLGKEEFAFLFESAIGSQIGVTSPTIDALIAQIDAAVAMGDKRTETEEAVGNAAGVAAGQFEGAKAKIIGLTRASKDMGDIFSGYATLMKNSFIPNREAENKLMAEKIRLSTLENEILQEKVSAGMEATQRLRTNRSVGITPNQQKTPAPTLTPVI